MHVETAFAPFPDWAAFTIVTRSLLRVISHVPENPK
jgi:hypothetical protein